MANLLTEGFDWFPTGQNAATRARLWAANNMFAVGSYVSDVETGRFGFGNALSTNSTSSFAGNDGYVWPVGANVTTGFFGFACFIYDDTTQTAPNGPAFGFMDGVNDIYHLFIHFDANGVIKVYRGPAGSGSEPTTGTLLATSAPGAFQDQEWFHVEMKAVIANSGGSLEVRINTVPVIQLTGADTQNNSSSFAYFDCVTYQGSRGTGGSGKVIHFAMDDMFVNDTSGSENNDWMGNVRVKTQFMTANGATNNFTIGGSSPAATHWQSVLNNILDDTQFEYSGTIGNIDLFVPDPNLNSPLVHAVQVRMGLRQDDATQRSAHAMLRIGSTNYEGVVGQYTNQTFTFYKERWQHNPATGVSFTGADVNGLQAGLKLVT